MKSSFFDVNGFWILRHDRTTYIDFSWRWRCPSTEMTGGLGVRGWCVPLLRPLAKLHCRWWVQVAEGYLDIRDLVDSSGHLTCLARRNQHVLRWFYSSKILVFYCDIRIRCFVTCRRVRWEQISGRWSTTIRIANEVQCYSSSRSQSTSWPLRALARRNMRMTPLLAGKTT
jgi:hypothetical protein